jgi:hypothetical protein
VVSGDLAGGDPMTWVRQASDVFDKQHECVCPVRDQGTVLTVTRPAGEFGDLWRCDDCGRLWRLGNDCDTCDPAPPGGNCRRGGHHPQGLKWRPATLFQRLTHWRSR